MRLVRALLFHRTAPPETYTLFLHDALPIWAQSPTPDAPPRTPPALPSTLPLFPLPDVVLFPDVSLPLRIFEPRYRDRKSTRLNSSHSQISYAVFCLTKTNYTTC